MPAIYERGLYLVSKLDWNTSEQEFQKMHCVALQKLHAACSKT